MVDEEGGDLGDDGVAPAVEFDFAVALALGKRPDDCGARVRVRAGCRSRCRASAARCRAAAHAGGKPMSQRAKWVLSFHGIGGSGDGGGGEVFEADAAVFAIAAGDGKGKCPRVARSR